MRGTNDNASIWAVRRGPLCSESLGFAGSLKRQLRGVIILTAGR